MANEAPDIATITITRDGEMVTMAFEGFISVPYRMSRADALFLRDALNTLVHATTQITSSVISVPQNIKP